MDEQKVLQIAEFQDKDFTVYKNRDTDDGKLLYQLFQERRAAIREGQRDQSVGDRQSIECAVLLTNKPGGKEVRARAAICPCFEDRYLSATFRIVDDVPSEFPNSVPDIKYRRSTYLSSDRKDNMAQLIYGRIWPRAGRPSGSDEISKEKESNELSGLIYLTGATKSGKNFQAKAIIHQYLSDVRFQKHWKDTRRRRAHLLTYEDPIESYLKIKNDDPDGPEALGKVGIDYTPRQKGRDASSLSEVISNALRQTPAILFVGETRDEGELRNLIDFAGTGHLVITTGHAHSLRESVGKLLAACRASTPVARREVADKLCAVVHLLPKALPAAETASKKEEPQVFRIPAVFRANTYGRQALMAEGRTCLLPFSSPADQIAYCWGRSWFIDRLKRRAMKPEDAPDLRRWGKEQDLAGL